MNYRVLRRHGADDSAQRRQPENILVIGTDNSPGGHVWPRYAPIARALGAVASVTLIDPSDHINNGSVHRQRNSALSNALRRANAIFLDGRTLPLVKPFLQGVEAPISIDLYDPLIAGDTASVLCGACDRAALIGDQITTGDFFLCKNEAQRDYWIGILTALNGINPLTYSSDKSLFRLIDIVPFAIDGLGYATRQAQGERPKSDAKERVTIWLLEDKPWLDPVSLISAVDRLKCHRDVRVIFIIPDAVNGTGGVVANAIQHSRRLGLIDQHVSFVKCSSFEDSRRLISTADIAVSLQLDRFEARYADRPELAAYLEAEVPILASPHNASFVEEYGAGILVGHSDIDAVALALEDVLSNEQLRSELKTGARKAAASQDRNYSPLLQWCFQPWKAADWLEGLRCSDVGVLPSVPPTRLTALPALALHYARTTGPLGLAREVRSYVSWRLFNKARANA